LDRSCVLTVRVSERWLRLLDTRREKGTARLIRDSGRHTKGCGSSKAAPLAAGRGRAANTHSSHGFNGFNSLWSDPDLARRSAPIKLPGAAPGAGSSRMQSEVQTECVRGGAQGFGELLSTYMASECEQREDKAVDQTFLRRQEEFTRLMEWNCKSSLASDVIDMPTCIRKGSACMRFIRPRRSRPRVFPPHQIPSNRNNIHPR
jgi:hypothetical protein